MERKGRGASKRKTGVVGREERREDASEAKRKRASSENDLLRSMNRRRKERVCARERGKKGNGRREAHGPCIERSNHYVVKVGLCPLA